MQKDVFYKGTLKAIIPSNQISQMNDINSIILMDIAKNELL